MKLSKGEQIFSVCNHIVLALLALGAVYPFLYVLSASISSGDAVITGKVVLWPVELTLAAYRQVLNESSLWMAYANTIFYTVAGTAVNVAFTIFGAYPLSKKRLLGRGAIGFFIAFTMLFSAGMIPFYLNLRDLGLLNTRTAIIFAFAITTFNVIILRSFFQTIPEDLEEAAKVDGASDAQILWKVVLPLSKPSLAAISLFYAVSRWNGYFWAMVILQDERKIPLQVLLNKLVVNMKPTEDMMTTTDVAAFSQETVIYATIVLSVLPIVAVYPFIQKYFVKGVMIGSVKG
ncbi:carbohydrate ABC transporter permease [Paenibacillus sp. YN15]|uniref:carbohydrate ABC transporter permease n=1 Tax=Paenibacillus sp. YN15 TaxID=1742774 RepID=UPI000DCC9BC6|nr:carbohydrate ABC transporter permease [Paenibacillus sp. YN15]RAU91861.1 carbohydrate ABC transporter permease [Paenibacillus sp. YN15]